MLCVCCAMASGPGTALAFIGSFALSATGLVPAMCRLFCQSGLWIPLPPTVLCLLWSSIFQRVVNALGTGAGLGVAWT